MFTQLSKRDITLAYIISVIIALIMCVASVAGILYGNDIYPASQVSNNIGTDALNPVVGVPILLGSMVFARRGSLIGLLIWQGGALLLPYVALVTLSAYTIIGCL